VFVSGEYEAFDKDVTRFEPGQDSDKWGGTVGVDYGFTPWLVAGAAFTYDNTQGDFKRNAGSFETDSYGGFLYASILPMPQLFIDVVGGYARKDYSIDRRSTVTIGGTPFSGTFDGDTDGDEWRAGVNAGYDFVLGNVTVGPRVGVNYKRTEIDGYRESGGEGPNQALQLRYRDQVEESLTSSVGVAASAAFGTRFGVLVPQGTLDYVHEFEDDQRTIRFSFVQDVGQNTLRFQNDRPDRDYLTASIGLAMVLPGGMSPFVNYRTLIGYEDHARHTVTVGLRIPF
jgi:outer membrane lipase/esterase